MGVDLDGVRKEQQLVKAKLKQLTDEREVMEKEISSLEAELTAATETREKAYEAFQELKKQREEGNTCYYQNRTFLNKASDIAAKKDIEALKEVKNIELSRDGRMRNPDEKPLVSQESSAKPSAVETVAKANVKKAKEDPISAPIDASVVEKAPKEAKNSKPTGSGITLEPVELEVKGGISGSEKLQGDPQPKRIEVVDEAKLKEMRREEEIAKAKLAVERKKKLAEKAAIKAHKEAEKKLKPKKTSRNKCSKIFAS